MFYILGDWLQNKPRAIQVDHEIYSSLKYQKMKASLLLRTAVNVICSGNDFLIPLKFMTRTNFKRVEPAIFITSGPVFPRQCLSDIAGPKRGFLGILFSACTFIRQS